MNHSLNYEPQTPNHPPQTINPEPSTINHLSLCRYGKAEANAMNSFQHNTWFGFQVLAQFTDKYIHAAAQEKIILAPNVDQHFFPLYYLVRMLTKKL